MNRAKSGIFSKMFSRTIQERKVEEEEKKRPRRRVAVKIMYELQ